MSNVPSLVTVPRLDCEKAVKDGMSLLQQLDKGELQEFMENEEVNINNVIMDLDEVCSLLHCVQIVVNRTMYFRFMMNAYCL
jgi:uncharacterized protein (UPF0264 family)